MDPPFPPSASAAWACSDFYGSKAGRDDAESRATIAERKGCSAAQLAIAWVLARGEDIVPLVGTTKRTRLQENLHALDVVLDAADLAELDEAFAPGAIAGERYNEQQMQLVAR